MMRRTEFDRERSAERDDGFLLIGACLTFDFAREILQQVRIGASIGEDLSACSEEVEALRNELFWALVHAREVRSARIKEAPRGHRRGPFSDFTRGRFWLTQVQLHPPTHWAFRAAQDSLLNDLHPSGNRDLECPFSAEPCFDRLLCCRSARRSSLSPRDILQANGGGIPPLQHRRELPF